MVNYQLGKIYKIECMTTHLVYYGATCEPILTRRLAGHRDSFNRYISGKSTSYMSSFEVLKTENYIMSLVENFSCNSKDELSTREAYYILNNDCVNKQVPLGKSSVSRKHWKLLFEDKATKDKAKSNEPYSFLYKPEQINEVIAINQANRQKIEMKLNRV